MEERNSINNRRNTYIYEKNRESLEYFYPSPDSNERRASAKMVVFNLVSTVVGGGILSIPYAFDKCGIICALLFMILSAMASSFTVYILVSCSRRSGAESYEEIAEKSYGKKAQYFTMFLVILLTFLVFVAYLILIKDIGSSLINKYFFPSGTSLLNYQKNIIMILLLLCMSPTFFFRSLYSLRFTSILSIFSIGILLITVTIRANEIWHISHIKLYKLKYWPTNWSDCLFGLPIITVAFLCHFNILPVYGGLKKPTRKRLKTISITTTSCAFFLYMIVGIMGYICGFQDLKNGGVQDDILNNFSIDDPLINLGRVALIFTLLFALPLVLFPCRETLLRFYCTLTIFSKEIKNTPRSSTYNERKSLINTRNNDEFFDEDIIEDEKNYDYSYGRIILTITLVSFAVFVAFSLPGVAIVWNAIGASVGLIISYIIPSICYIKIRHMKAKNDKRIIASWILFITSGFTCFLCSFQTVANLFY